MESENPYAMSGAPSDVPAERGWWARNWKWFVPVLVIVLLVIPCCTCVGGMWWLGSQWQALEPMPQALQVIEQDPAVQAALGTPIEAGMLPSDFHVNYHNQTGEARAAFDITGPSDGAAVTLEATYDGTHWHFDELIVNVQGTGEQIDLSGASAPSGSP